ncbi:MAG TPA: metal-dependent hydrolase, partial [Deltaproteobacteria bacterium]|nr:metal-dependent hydrolase [Deltaproteobacteria bacterium]
MDPLTHGLLGGVTAQALFRKKVNLAITTAGMLGGMAPDLDILIQSKTNPLLMFEYHRNFTHSLAFIPLGGAFVGFLLWLLWRRKPPLKTMLLAAIAGYATHGLLDACTSYGTMLYWPFSRERISWDWIFILDPFYTFPLLVGLWISLRRKQGNAALSALVLTSLYLGVGVFQHHRALSYQQALAEQRGQSLQKGRVIPMLGPFLIWRSIEITGEQVQVEALRVGYSGAKKNWGRSSLPHFNSSSVPIPAESILGRDMQIFEW